jgi:hypothetical protein
MLPARGPGEGKVRLLKSLTKAAFHVTSREKQNGDSGSREKERGEMGGKEKSWKRHRYRLGVEKGIAEPEREHALMLARLDETRGA